jgi:hypothetical protein
LHSKRQRDKDKRNGKMKSMIEKEEESMLKNNLSLRCKEYEILKKRESKRGNQWKNK